MAAEVSVNGRLAGVRYAAPYSFDLSDLAVVGENVVEVTVANTLANFYSEGFPTKHVLAGQTVSGLLGPVQISFAARVSLQAHRPHQQVE